jgi:hypothetical protein
MIFYDLPETIGVLPVSITIDIDDGDTAPAIGG